MPILLVPTKQFEKFLGEINQQMGLHLTIPSGPTNDGGFRVTFSNDGTPQPRYLGRALNRETAERLHLEVPPSKYTRDFVTCTCMVYAHVYSEYNFLTEHFISS